jgi:hypothetical protein
VGGLDTVGVRRMPSPVLRGLEMTFRGLGSPLDGTNDSHRFGALKEPFPVRSATRPGETASRSGSGGLIASEIG